MSDSGEDLKSKIRRVADEFEKYIGPDGRVNASALVDEIERLRTIEIAAKDLTENYSASSFAAFTDLVHDEHDHG